MLYETPLKTVEVTEKVHLKGLHQKMLICVPSGHFPWGGRRANQTAQGLIGIISAPLAEIMHPFLCSYRSAFIHKVRSMYRLRLSHRSRRSTLQSTELTSIKREYRNVKTKRSTSFHREMDRCLIA